MLNYYIMPSLQGQRPRCHKVQSPAVPSCLARTASYRLTSAVVRSLIFCNKIRINMRDWLPSVILRAISFPPHKIFHNIFATNALNPFVEQLLHLVPIFLRNHWWWLSVLSHMTREFIVSLPHLDQTSVKHWMDLECGW